MKKEIVIYGAGKYGKTLNDSLAELGVNFSFFLERIMCWGNKWVRVYIYDDIILMCSTTDSWCMKLEL